jgi:hypothetical protein
MIELKGSIAQTILSEVAPMTAGERYEYMIILTKIGFVFNITLQEDGDGNLKETIKVMMDENADTPKLIKEQNLEQS